MGDAANSDPEEGEGELADAEEALEEAGELNGDALQRQEFFATVVKTFGLIFVAEWGDRSMLATIALGAAQSPWVWLLAPSSGMPLPRSSPSPVALCSRSTSARKQSDTSAACFSCYLLC